MCQLALKDHPDTRKTFIYHLCHEDLALSVVSVCPFIHPSFCPSFSPSVHRPVRPSIDPSVCPSVYPSISQPIHSSVAG
eukprot:m.94623 g.94623  ORF g.94623 m.94623 type:complete len:79 (+) comp36826_c0_seq1:78-314(+)